MLDINDPLIAHNVVVSWARTSGDFGEAEAIQTRLNYKQVTLPGNLRFIAHSSFCPRSCRHYPVDSVDFASKWTRHTSANKSVAAMGKYTRSFRANIFVLSWLPTHPHLNSALGINSTEIWHKTIHKSVLFDNSFRIFLLSFIWIGQSDFSGETS